MLRQLSAVKSNQKAKSLGGSMHRRKHIASTQPGTPVNLSSSSLFFWIKKVTLATRPSKSGLKVRRESQQDIDVSNPPLQRALKARWKGHTLADQDPSKLRIFQLQFYSDTIISAYQGLLLMVQKSGDHHLRCIKPCKLWNKLPTSTGEFAEFLNHHQYHPIRSISKCQAKAMEKQMVARRNTTSRMGRNS